MALLKREYCSSGLKGVAPAAVGSSTGLPIYVAS
jgi:hypothetical protein